MRSFLRIAFAGVAAALALSVATSADAKCTRLAFSVNDYGKVGPTNDAKALLDKYIAQWTAERGIKTYRTGKKDVSCELFLDVIVFDEYTCRAEATVCWNEAGGAPAKAGATPKATATPAKSSEAGSPAAKPAAAKPAAKAAETKAQ